MQSNSDVGAYTVKLQSRADKLCPNLQKKSNSFLRFWGFLNKFLRHWTGKLQNRNCVHKTGCPDNRFGA